MKYLCDCGKSFEKLAAQEACGERNHQEHDVNAMVEAHKAGMAYWKRNKPPGVDGIATVARSCGWTGELETAWLAGYFGAKAREHSKGKFHPYRP